MLAANTYEEIIAESKGALLKYVSRDRAIIDLLHMPQADKSVTEFVAQVEDQAALCRQASRPLPGFGGQQQLQDILSQRGHVHAATADVE